MFLKLLAQDKTSALLGELRKNYVVKFKGNATGNLTELLSKMLERNSSGTGFRDGEDFSA